MSKQKLTPPRRIAPRLANGLSRVNIGHRLPPHVKEALRFIADRDHESMGWILERWTIAMLHTIPATRKMPTPEYVLPKAQQTEAKQTQEQRGREAAEQHAKGNGSTRRK